MFKTKKSIFITIGIFLTIGLYSFFTAGIVLQYWGRYMPVNWVDDGKGGYITYTGEGEYVPYIELGSIRKDFILPFLGGFMFVKPNYTISIMATNPTINSQYHKLKYFTLNKFTIKYANGIKQTIIPGDKEIIYFSRPEQSKPFIPSVENMKYLTFKICNGTVENCYSEMGPIKLISTGKMNIIMEGTYLTINDKTEKFKFSQEWKEEDSYKFRTGWSMLP
jgi:hypothetical protein